MARALGNLGVNEQFASAAAGGGAHVDGCRRIGRDAFQIAQSVPSGRVVAPRQRFEREFRVDRGILGDERWLAAVGSSQCFQLDECWSERCRVSRPLGNSRTHRLQLQPELQDLALARLPGGVHFFQPLQQRDQGFRPAFVSQPLTYIVQNSRFPVQHLADVLGPQSLFAHGAQRRDWHDFTIAPFPRAARSLAPAGVNEQPHAIPQGDGVVGNNPIRYRSRFEIAQRGDQRRIVGLRGLCPDRSRHGHDDKRQP